MAHLLTAPNIPLFSWEIGQAPFDANAVKNVIDNRWVIELVPTTIYSATRKAVNAFGGQLAKLRQRIGLLLRFSQLVGEICDHATGQRNITGFNFYVRYAGKGLNDRQE